MSSSSNTESLININNLFGRISTIRIGYREFSWETPYYNFIYSDCCQIKQIFRRFAWILHVLNQPLFALRSVLVPVDELIPQ
jgi:hypothetical protein